MKHWQKKKQIKLANERALQQAEDAKKIQDAAAKEEEKQAAILALQAEQDKMRKEAVEELADTAAVISYQNQGSLLAKAGSLPSENPEDYEMEEPTGVFGKLSNWAKNLPKSVKRTGAAIGAAVIILSLVRIKGCTDDNQPNQIEETPRPSQEQTVTPSVPVESEKIEDFISAAPTPQVSEEPEFLDVTPEPTVSVEPVHTHGYTTFVGTTYRTNNNGTHNVDSTYKCECGEKTVKTTKANCEYVKYSSDSEYEYFACKDCGHKIKKTHTFATLLGTTYKANEDGTHNIEYTYGCGCGEKTIKTAKVDCEYVKYDSDEEFEYYACKDCGHKIKKAHTFATLLNTTYEKNGDGTHKKNSTYECECGEKTVISKVENCLYKIYNYDSQKEYLECGNCHYKTTRKHDMKGETQSNKDIIYSCTHTGCDYTYTEEYVPPYIPSDPIPSDPGTNIPTPPPTTPPSDEDDIITGDVEGDLDDIITNGVEDDLNLNQIQTGDEDNITIDVNDNIGNAEARIDKTTMGNTFAYGLGGYGFDNNDLGNGHGFTRSRRL